MFSPASTASRSAAAATTSRMTTAFASPSGERNCCCGDAKGGAAGIGADAPAGPAHRMQSPSAVTGGLMRQVEHSMKWTPQDSGSFRKNARLSPGARGKRNVAPAHRDVHRHPVRPAQPVLSIVPASAWN